MPAARAVLVRRRQRRPLEHGAPPAPKSRVARERRRGHRRAKHRWHGTLALFGFAFVVVFLVLVAFRIALPSIVASYVNGVLDSTPDYAGGFKDIDINLWRGAYSIDQLRIDRVNGGVPAPLLSVDRLDLSVYWGALAAGSIAGEVDLAGPVVHMVFAKAKEVEQIGEQPSWNERLNALFPFHLVKLAVRDGEVRVTNLGTQPATDLWIKDLFVDARNLTNRVALAQGKPAVIEIAGRPFGTGELVGRLRMDITAEQPKFEVDLALRRIDLRQLNDFLKAYADVDVEAGTLDVYVELAAEKGHVEGYVKVLIRGLQVLRFQEIDSPKAALEAVWEALVATGAEILKNQPHDLIATRVPIAGKLDSPGVGIVTTVWNLVKNAFIQALGPGIEIKQGAGDLPVTKAEANG